MASYLLAAKRFEGGIQTGFPGPTPGAYTFHPLATFEKQKVAESVRDRFSDTTEFDLVVKEVKHKPSLEAVDELLGNVPEESLLTQMIQDRKEKSHRREKYQHPLEHRRAVERSIDSYDELEK